MKLDFFITTMNQEQIYDQQIKPLMDQIIQVCKENQINLHASFFLRNFPDDLTEEELQSFFRGNPVEGCETCIAETHLQFNEPAWMRLMHYLVTSGSNFDLFISKVVADARTNGHGSMILSMLINFMTETE